ncbi:MAG: helix-turn-helix transcriptional regulator [Vicinamibacterales bacterium]
MPRNAEVIRQWTLLLELDAARHGLSVDELARKLEVTKRTIWRDMQALQAAGFPLVDQKRERRTVWTLAAAPLKALSDPSLSFVEVCSLYMGRAVVSGLTGRVFAGGLASAFRKIERVLSPKMRAFLDELPGVLAVKPGALKTPAAPYFDAIVGRLIEASLERRTVHMRYYSASSDREKDYEVHPYTVAFADGGYYLTAYVPEYRQLRMFAAERIRKCTVATTRFERTAQLGTDALVNSLGVNQGGVPERIQVEFTRRVAPYVRERTWHPSQVIKDVEGGGVRLTMEVCRDWALHTWILGFGPHARVVSPASLAGEIYEQLESARDGYAPRLMLDAAPVAFVGPAQAELPLRSGPGRGPASRSAGEGGTPVPPARTRTRRVNAMRE